MKRSLIKDSRGNSKATATSTPMPGWPSFQFSDSSVSMTHVMATKKVPSKLHELNCPPSGLSSICLVIADCVILRCPILCYLNQFVCRYIKHSQVAPLVHSLGPASSVSGAGCTWILAQTPVASAAPSWRHVQGPPRSELGRLGAQVHLRSLA